MLHIGEMKRWLIAGIVAGVVFFVIDALSLYFGAPLYGLNANLWKATGGTKYLSIFMVDLFFGIVFGYVYSMIRGHFHDAPVFKGMKFGVLLWVLAAMPAVLGAYLLIAIPDVIISMWFVVSLIESILAGIVIGIVYESMV
jgi:uncharacterized membrane protein YagU involved in acid resistance